MELSMYKLASKWILKYGRDLLYSWNDIYVHKLWLRDIYCDKYETSSELPGSNFTEQSVILR